MQREPKLSEYALIGNSCSAALVSRHGSIDWCCLPEFDSPSIFASLLDRKKGGHFSLTPESEYSSRQKYLDNTNVAETSFETSTGSVTLTDAFVAMHEAEKASSLQPDHEILRMIEGKSGRVMMKLEYSPALFYGRDFPSLHDRGNLGIQLSWKENILILLTTLPPASIDTYCWGGSLHSATRPHSKLPASKTGGLAWPSDLFMRPSSLQLACS